MSRAGFAGWPDWSKQILTRQVNRFVNIGGLVFANAVTGAGGVILPVCGPGRCLSDFRTRLVR